MPLVTITAPGLWVFAGVSMLVSRQTALVDPALGATALDLGGSTDCLVSMRGTVRAPAGSAIREAGSAANNVIAVSADARAHGQDFAVFLAGAHTGLANSGRLTAAVTGVQFVGDDASLANAGRIVAGTGPALAVYGDRAALANDGSIRSGQIGVYLVGADAALVNTGRIVGGQFALFATKAAAIDNEGRIVGKGGAAIGLSAEDDVVVNRGLIRGDVALGDGANVYDGGGGRVTGTVAGVAGADRIWGGGWAEHFVGGAANDDLRGRGGADILAGGADNDSLDGGRGDDRLIGGAGSDVFDGGAGDDRLRGGPGGDYFDYGAGKQGRDRIVDWEDGTDQFYFGALGLSMSQQTHFLNHGIGKSHGNAVIDLGAIPGHVAAGTIIVKGAAGEIDTGDFLF